MKTQSCQKSIMAFGAIESSMKWKWVYWSSPEINNDFPLNGKFDTDMMKHVGIQQ